MKIIKNRLFLLIAILFLSFQLTSCYRPNSAHSSGRSDLFAMANFAVPFLAGNDEWDEIDVLEVDKFGRTMFTYKSFNQSLPEFNNQFVFTLLICQQSDNEYAYYYDNYSFTISSGNFSFTNDEIDKLKSRNDWNNELQPDKFTKIKRNFGPYDELAAYKKQIISDNLSSYLATSEKKYDIDLIAIDSDLKYLFAAREYIKVSEKLQFGDIYFVITDDKFNISSNSCVMKIADILNCQSQMQAIKSQNIWSEENYVSS